MKKLNEILGKKILEGNFVGIEIEAEGENISVTKSKYWKSEDDGSLRGEFPNQRHEFVSDVLELGVVEKALDDLANEQKNAKFDFSFRTSTHVHVNVLDMPVDKIVSFVYLYFLFEKDLLKYCGPYRENNRFCLRLVDSEFQLDVLKGAIENSFRDLRFLISEEMRYAACNMAALLKYGTLEFRGMRGAIDKKEILPWVNILVRFKNLAMEYESTYQIYQEALKDPNKFIRKIYGEYHNVFAGDFSYGNLTEALSLTIEIPFTTQVWLNHEKARAAIEPAIKPNRQRVRPVPERQVLAARAEWEFEPNREAIQVRRNVNGAIFDELMVQAQREAQVVFRGNI